MSLSKDLFADRLKKRNRPRTKVPVPELSEEGGEEEYLCVEELTAEELAGVYELQDERKKAGKNGLKQFGSFTQHLVGLSLVDDKTGARFYANLMDIKKGMVGISHPILNRLFEACLELNKVDEKSAEELRKNSESDLENGSGSNSDEKQDAASPS
mgnify:CR=1 FL=1|jgi:hypothetical protein